MKAYCHLIDFSVFALLTGFVEFLGLAVASNHNSSRIYTVYDSLRQALSLLSLLCHQQSSGNGFQLFPRFIHSEPRLTPTQLLSQGDLL